MPDLPFLAERSAGNNPNSDVMRAVIFQEFVVVVAHGDTLSGGISIPRPGFAAIKGCVEAVARFAQTRYARRVKR